MVLARNEVAVTGFSDLFQDTISLGEAERKQQRNCQKIR